MEKEILKQYSDTCIRVKYLRGSLERLGEKIAKMSCQGYYVTDVVTKGKKGKKPLGSVKVSGFPYETYQKKRKLLQKRKEQLEKEEQTLLEEQVAVEEYISGIVSVEIRNIFSLYYIEDMNWVQVAHQMNLLYGGKRKKYTESSCRQKHDRFLEKD